MAPIHQVGEAKEITRAVPLPHGAAFVLQEYLPEGKMRSSVVISEWNKEPKTYPIPERHTCVELLYAQDNLYVLYRREAGKQGGGTMVVSPNGVKYYELIGAMGVYESENAVRFRNRQNNQDFRLFPAPLVHIRKREEWLLAASTHNAVLIKDFTPYSLGLSRISAIDVDIYGNVAVLTETEKGIPMLRMGNISRVIPEAAGARRIEFIPPRRCIIIIPSGVLLVDKEVTKVNGVVWASYERSNDCTSSVVVVYNNECMYQVYYLPVNGNGLFDFLKWLSSTN